MLQPVPLRKGQLLDIFNCAHSRQSADQHCKDFYYDAVRTPWRFAMAVAWHCDSRAKNEVDMLLKFFSSLGGAMESYPTPTKHTHTHTTTPAPHHTTPHHTTPHTTQTPPRTYPTTRSPPRPYPTPMLAPILTCFFLSRLFSIAPFLTRCWSHEVMLWTAGPDNVREGYRVNGDPLYGQERFPHLATLMRISISLTDR